MVLGTMAVFTFVYKSIGYDDGKVALEGKIYIPI